MMDNPTANKSHMSCQSWAHNGWSTTSSQGHLLNPLGSSQHLSLGASSDHRPSYDHLQATDQSCMSDLSTLSARNSIHHGALYRAPHMSNISSSTSLFASSAIPSASHIISFSQQSPHTSSVLKTIPPPSIPQTNQGLHLHHLPLLSPHDPYKAFQTPLTGHGLPNALQDLPVSLPSCGQRGGPTQATFEERSVESAPVARYTNSNASSSTSQEQPQWIPSSLCRRAVNDSVPDAAGHPPKEPLQEDSIAAMVSNERRRSVLLNQRSQLLKQLEEMDKILESLPPDECRDVASPHTAVQSSPSTDDSSQYDTRDAHRVQLSAGKAKLQLSADCSPPLFSDDQNESCDSPSSPMSPATSVKKENASGESGDEGDPDSSPDFDDGFKCESNDGSSDEMSHGSPSTPTDKTPPLPGRKRDKSGSSLCTDNSGTPLKKTCATNQKKPSVLPMTNSKAQRVYDKRNYCVFCFKSVIKMARHLETVHCDKAEVAAAFQFPKHSKERQKIWNKLTNQGNFAHNKDVLRTGKGHLAVRKRPKITGQAHDFLHCLYCQGLYGKKALYRHIKKCPEKEKNENESQIGRQRIASRCALATLGDFDISESVRSILSDMVYDDVTQVVMDDKVILQFGEQMFNQYGCDVKKHHYIRQNLRQIARLVLEAQKITPMQKLEDFFYPSNFQHVVSAVNVLAGYDPENKTYSIPSLALKLGYNLQKTCSIVESNALKCGDAKLAECARSFLSVYQKKWNTLISSGALTTLKTTKLNTEKQVPLAQDVKRLHFHLENVHRLAEKKLRESPSVENYCALAKVMLSRTIMFNRRRPRQISMIQLAAFLSRKKSSELDDMATSVSDLERTMCGFFARVDIRGNCGRMVPVLLKPSLVSALELLVNSREGCGIPRKNPYLFARPSALSAYNGSDCLQRFVRECGAKKPAALSSKKIRKHFAAMLQVMNLDENEADQILGPNNQVQILRQNSDMTLDDVEIESGARLQPARGQQAPSWDHNERFSAGCGPADLYHQQAHGETTSSTMTTPPTSVRSGEQATADVDMSFIHFSSSPVAESNYKAKHKWEEAEVHAVERHLMCFIQGHKVPQKSDCIQCLAAEPKALRTRSWKGVKDYVRNRITALKRQSGCSQGLSKNGIGAEPRQSDGCFQQL
ncbi:uncharacterized protein [Embiotoca jacksoni]|uniref:uncharacterized protein n=1 Tax=Embiotoca jacksoni TaxID=100190 RepID=UPI003703F414